jgi:hypothetical protein
MEMGQYAEGETAQDLFKDLQTRVRRTSTAPILKDTIAVPSAGYAIIKFKANNPGKLFYSKINPINRKQIPPIQSNTLIKPIWTYRIQLWGTASNSNIEILQRFQSKTLRSILNAPRYINNHRLYDDLHMNTVLSETKKKKSGIPNTTEN